MGRRRGHCPEALVTLASLSGRRHPMKERVRLPFGPHGWIMLGATYVDLWSTRSLVVHLVSRNDCGPELGRGAIHVDRELVAARLVDSSIPDHLSQQVLCRGVGVLDPLELLDLLLELLDHGRLLIVGRLFLSLCFLIGLDLRQGAAALARGLEQIG